LSNKHNRPSDSQAAAEAEAQAKAAAEAEAQAKAAAEAPKLDTRVYVLFPTYRFHNPLQGRWFEPGKKELTELDGWVKLQIEAQYCSIVPADDAE